MVRFWRAHCQNPAPAPVIGCHYWLDPGQTSRPATQRTLALGSDSRRVRDYRGAWRVTSGEENIFGKILGELTISAILIGVHIFRAWKLHIGDRCWLDLPLSGPETLEPFQ